MIHSGAMQLGGQYVRVHDEGLPAGYIHTFESFRTPGAPYGEHKLQVFLPRDYDESHLHYRVLYMNDGHTIFDRGGLGCKSWNLATTLADLYSAQMIPPVIVVGIWPVDRNREYTYAKWFGPECCEVDGYTDTVTRWIKPFVDRNYRTLPSPTDAMILGSSHGGLAAFFIALSRPSSFGSCAAMSPSFWVGVDDATDFPVIRPRSDKRLRDSKLISIIKSKNASRGSSPRLYMDWGLRRDGGAHNEFIEERATERGREMAELMKSDFGYRLGVDLMTYEDPLGEHDENSWGRRIPRALKWFFAENG